MKTKEIFSAKNIEDLEKTLGEHRESLRRFRFSAVQSKIKNVKLGRELRRDVARILTRISQLKKT